MRYIAVIDIGSTAVRLSVMEIPETDGESSWKILESAEKISSLGQNVFEQGFITQETIEQIIGHIHQFRELYLLYNVEDVFLLGSSVITEAANRELLQDRILMETGHSIRVLGGMETNQLRFLALTRTLGASGVSLVNHHSLILDIGSSSTEVMYLKHGKMTWSNTLQIGILRDSSSIGLSPETWGDDLGEHIKLKTHRVLLQFSEEFNLQNIDQVIIMGRDIQWVAPYLGEKLSQGSIIIAGEDFLHFLNDVEKLSMNQIMERFGLNYQKAAALVPAMHIGANIFRLTGSEQLIVPPYSALEGVFMQFASSPQKIKSIFKEQIIASAWALSKHYHADQKHADYVRQSALEIYDFICQKKKLEIRHPILLEVAAILHDIGTYISSSSHHKHGQYLVQNSILFGLSPEQKRLVSLIVRYHRKATPSTSHRSYMMLSRENRLVVQQLSAVLRVADALDRAHQQRINFSLTIDDKHLIIHSQNHRDTALEQDSLLSKGNLFEQIYGITLLIR